MEPLRKQYTWELGDDRLIIQVGRDRAIVKIYIDGERMTIPKEDKALALQKKKIKDKVVELAFFAYLRMSTEKRVRPMHPFLTLITSKGLSAAKVEPIWEE